MDRTASYTLYELNALVRRTLCEELPDAYWVQAELSDVHTSASGHCYLEFVQKDAQSNVLLAKAKGVIWNTVFQLIKPYFEQETGQAFVSGIKVLVKVTVGFHELYGYSLTVIDIDPSYTLGDMARRRREILVQLEAEGVLTLNKELPFPRLAQRIAVISSATAAGYGDFCDQLLHNTKGYVFYPHLFPAVMQGERVEKSIIQALNAIYAHVERWDAVVIIRGGGATSDLSGFDTYLLASNCAQFPLPIITGIGHERDDTVIDSVAYARVKTPTAAAEFLLARMDEAADELSTCIDWLASCIHRQMERERLHLERVTTGLSAAVRMYSLSEKQRLIAVEQRLCTTLPMSLGREKHRLQVLSQRLRVKPLLSLSAQQYRCELLIGRLRQTLPLRFSQERYRLDLLQQQLTASSPEHQIKRGYSLVIRQGKVVTDPAQLKKGDTIEVRVAKGSFQAEVKEIE